MSKVILFPLYLLLETKKYTLLKKLLDTVKKELISFFIEHVKIIL